MLIQRQQVIQYITFSPKPKIKSYVINGHRVRYLIENNQQYNYQPNITRLAKHLMQMRKHSYYENVILV